ncbi:MAG: MotE family protein [Bacteriovoracaceae bacterium]
MKALIIFLFIFAPLTQAEDKKKYSESEFQEKLNELVKKEVEKRLTLSGRKRIVAFSHELFEKEKTIIQRELSLKKKEDALKLRDKHFDDRVKKLLEDQDRILGCIDGNKKKEDTRILHMVQVISGMRPNNAAQVLSVQEANITVKILGMLEPEKVSKIFNLMDKEISARLQKQYLTMEK